MTCAINFEHMVQLFIKDVSKSTAEPLGQIVDYFYRVEFQQRGSPHIYALFWVKGAPEYGEASDNTIDHFVDKYVTCKNNQSDEMRELINLQLHRHAKACRKLGHNVCRFNEIVILQPLEEFMHDESEFKIIKRITPKSRNYLMI